MKNVFYIFFLFCINVNATTYYVSTSGSNANNGTSPSTPWATLTYAASTSVSVTAGDVVYVKAGNYGAEHVVFTKSGTCGNPISFIGYTTTPGDQPTVLVNNGLSPYTAFSTTVMPTFTGSSRASTVGFSALGKEYLIFKNFQISTYSKGFEAGSADTSGWLVLDNINTMTIGNTADDYDGYGILFGSSGTKFSDHNVVRNCQVVNSCAENFGFNGDYNEVYNCIAYSNETSTDDASSDYYFQFKGSYNLALNCTANRTAGIYHTGHGFSCRTNANQVIDDGLSYPLIPSEHNRIINCTAVNIGDAFQARHRGSRFNLFYHCTAQGTHLGSDADGGEGNMIMIRDGCSFNTWDGCVGDSLNSGIEIGDSEEDGDTGGSPPGHPNAGNLVINCTFTNCYIPIKYTMDLPIASDCGENTIDHCTFYLNRYHIFAARRCTLMHYENSIFYGNSATGFGGYFKGNTYSSDVVGSQFQNCTFYNIDGGIGGFTHTGQLTTDPKFNNPTARDFTLQSSSPCINTGNYVFPEADIYPPLCLYANPFTNNLSGIDKSKRHTSGRHVTRDINGKIRITPDRGAYEY